MTRFRTLRGRIEPLVGAVVLGVAIVLLVLSSRTGKEEYDVANRELDRVEAVNARVDAAVLGVRFRTHLDFDLLTDLQRELQLASDELGPARPGAPFGIEPLVERKLVLVEEFKAQQAVVRNSIAIAAEMVAELWAHEPVLGQRTPSALLEVERKLLRYVASRDEAAGRALALEIETAERVRPDLASAEEWRLLSAHVQNLLEHRAGLEVLLDELFAIPLNESVATGRAEVDAAYAAAARVAGRYRIALFAVALLLLAFSAWKVVQVRGYVKLIECANETLEKRVASRTRELSDANAALQRQMREREEIEAQLRLAQKLESIGQLAAGIAHEINTPVQYVSDNLAFLTASWQDLLPVLDDFAKSMDAGDERRRDLWTRSDMEFVRQELPIALAAAGDGLKHISRIVLAMKEFSHPGSDDLRPADINRAIETTITVARNEWKYVAEVHTELGALPAVLCNVSSFNQVMLNLVVNAAQAIGEHAERGKTGNIWIKTQRVPGHVEIRVEDDGPGVPEAIRDQIFDPFFTTKEVGKGTGQGLSIAYRVICQQHGGTLTMEPRAGDGACFVIRLPLGAEHGRSTQAA